MVPTMNTKGEESPALPAMRAEMKMTPMVGEMNASDMARALGSPRAFRFSWLSLAARVAGVVAADMTRTSSGIFVNCKEISKDVSIARFQMIAAGGPADARLEGRLAWRPARRSGPGPARPGSMQP